jgi:hypothetical protein
MSEVDQINPVSNYNFKIRFEGLKGKEAKKNSEINKTDLNLSGRLKSFLEQ